LKPTPILIVRPLAISHDIGKPVTAGLLEIAVWYDMLLVDVLNKLLDLLSIIKLKILLNFKKFIIFMNKISFLSPVRV
jgi:hypothetical protein